jgi:hypothetical protein
MVIRVVLCLSFLIVAFSSPCISGGLAPGPAYYQQSSCAPAPCPTYRPCGPRPLLPVCAGLIGSCSAICGTVLGCPAAIMRTILAPPPRRCRPPRCATWCPPPQPVCAPPPVAPQRIAKTRAAVHAPAAPMCTPQAPCGRAGCPLVGRGGPNPYVAPPVYAHASGQQMAQPQAFGPFYADTSGMPEEQESGLFW